MSARYLIVVGDGCFAYLGVDRKRADMLSLPSVWAAGGPASADASPDIDLTGVEWNAGLDEFTHEQRAQARVHVIGGLLPIH